MHSRRLPRPTFRLLAVACFGSVVALAGCGSGGSSPGASGAATTAATTGSAGSSAGAGSTAPTGGGSTDVAAGGTTGSGVAGGAAATLQQSFVSIVQRVNPSVVVIQTSQGLGSGVVFDTKGDIVTNAHVAGSATSFQVTSADGKTLPGTLVGTFAPDDVAVIRVNGGTLHPATFGDSSKLQVGDLVLAIGNPLGLQSSVTNGIVSAVGRVVQEPGGFSIPRMIQTSAPINPGNSGGALVDMNGDVVGIPTLAASDPQMGGSAPGIGFAVASNMATDIAHQLIANGRVTNSHRAYLGVQLADTQAGSGALVAALQPGGPAAAAGIVAGDLITSIDSHPTPTTGDLSDVLATYQPGQVVSVAIQSQTGASRTVKVTLGQYPG